MTFHFILKENKEDIFIEFNKPKPLPTAKVWAKKVPNYIEKRISNVISFVEKVVGKTMSREKFPTP